MNIIKEKWKFLNSTIKHIPPKQSKLYRFGLETLAVRRIHSLRANARLIPINWNTAKSKSYRLTRNRTISGIFVSLIKQLSLVQERDIIAVDFSDFGNGFQVLMFAKQTKGGRAMPVYFEILRYPIKKGSQSIFIIQAISNFVNILGFRPKLVFDRGFALPHLIKYLHTNQHIFIIRIKKSKSLETRKKRVFKAKDARKKDLLVTAYGLNLRLIISDDPNNGNDPWYLITNDLDSKRNEVILHYYHRFEIEEFFRDAKRLLGLEYISFKKKNSLTIVLWFLILGHWFFETLEILMSEKERKARETWQLSKARYFIEMIERQYIISAEGGYLTLKCS